MTQTEVTIRNRAGIHARPASLIVKTANKYQSQVFLEKDGMKINAKSIMGIITLGASHNTRLLLSAEGPDESEVVTDIARLFETRFEEE
jgi:phosphocarrier protein HPr